MSDTNPERIYHDLIIVASSATTEIWLGDDGGHFVQKAIGTLETSLLPGDYTVEFGLGAPPYLIQLVKPSQYTQAELVAGPPCPRPIVKLLPE